ncbi:uncharacterized protein [Amphiura filiformis]|uniref:uncharacterized protein isoform X2 n=1 Tax=Amphiura filiformis TaxID=82378 RepID=UPI003B20CD69
MAFSYLVKLPRRLYIYIRNIFYTQEQRWSKVAETDESDWSETDDELLDPGVKKAKREKIQQKLAKTKERHRANKEAAERAKAQKQTEARKGSIVSLDEKEEEDEERGGSQKSKSGKPPPPIAPKPKKSSITNTSSSSLNSTNSTDATSQDKVESTESLEIETKTPPETPEDASSSSPGREAPISFDESAREKPQLKSYRRVQGPQGRRRPRRDSSQAMSQTMSTTLSQIMA